MRGEHLVDILTTLSKTGSSPHARGTHMHTGIGAGIGGIIPACAGNTNFFVHVWAWYWDHPRMRGEHLSSLMQLAG